MKRLASILVFVFTVSQAGMLILSSSMAKQGYVLNIADDETKKEKNDLKKDIDKTVLAPFRDSGISLNMAFPALHVLSAYASLNPEVATPPPDHC